MDNPVMRFTPQAVDTLKDLAQTRPELWANPTTDFQAELERLNLTDHSEPTHINAAAPIQMPPAIGYPRSLGDLPALDFYANLIGLQPRDLADIGIMAWISHQRLHDFAPSRWSQNFGTTNWIRQHYLNHRHADLARANLAGRLLWLAQTSHRAAGASGGAFTLQQALEHFCRYPEQYHTAVNSYNVLASDLALAEYVHAQMQGAYQHDRRGLALAQALNLRGGAVIIDALPRQAIRNTFSAVVQRLAEANAKKSHRYSAWAPASKVP